MNKNLNSILANLDERSSGWMFALVKSLVQIAGTKKANGLQRNLPKSLQNLHLTGKKRTGAFSYQIVQTCFSGWFFQETAWRHEWLISGLVWPCNRIKLVNSIDKTEWFWNIDICCFVGSKHWKNVARLQSSCSHQEVINLRSDTFGTPIFQTALWNYPSSLIISISGCFPSFVVSSQSAKI